MSSAQYVEYIVDLAREVETQDPIDWGMLSIDEETAFRLMAQTVVEGMMDKYNEPTYRDILLATIVKLVVENFVLNLKLRGQ